MHVIPLVIYSGEYDKILLEREKCSAKSGRTYFKLELANLSFTVFSLHIFSEFYGANNS